MKRSNCLLVEDDQDVRALISSLLEEKGCSVLAFENYTKAIDYPEAWLPKIAILDYCAPPGNALEFVEYLIGSRGLKFRKIILHSSLPPNSKEILRLKDVLKSIGKLEIFRHIPKEEWRAVVESI